MADGIDIAGTDRPELNRAGRRAAEKRAKRMRTTGAVLAAGAATFGTTATLVGVTASSAGAAELTVTNLDPDGAGSLHDVVEAANNGDVVVFQAGLTGAISLNDTIDIDTSVTIQGPGSDVITVSGNNHRIFDIDGPSSTDRIDVVISGLTLANGTGSFGGAIQVDDANLTVRDSTLADNQTNSGGGAIAGEDDNMDLVVENSLLTGNIADGDGGAIYWYSDGGSTTIINSTLSQNSGDDGGAAWLMGDNQPIPLTITNSTISGNTADDDGGGLTLYESAIAISNSTISGNIAGASGVGGGLFLYNVYGDINITNSTISGNTAGFGGGSWAYGIFGDSVNVTGSLISGNSATANNGDGAGLYFGYTGARTTIAFTTIEGNHAGGTGGAINWVTSGVLRVLNSTISGNTADDAGGGLYISSANYDVVEIFNSTISGNTTSGEGGGILFASYYGLQIAQSTITGNVGATIGGLAIYCAQDAAQAKAEQGGNTDDEAPKHEKQDRTRQQRVRAADFGDVSLSGTIISGNAGTDVGDCGTVTSDHSLIGTIVGSTLSDLGGTILGKLPLVAPLANNGGPTQTHALLPDSPAINTGPNPVASFEGNNNDQRGEGFPRVVAGVVDIGAYEVQPPAVNFTG